MSLPLITDVLTHSLTPVTLILISLCLSAGTGSAVVPHPPALALGTAVGGHGLRVVTAAGGSSLAFSVIANLMHHLSSSLRDWRLHDCNTACTYPACI